MSGDKPEEKGAVASGIICEYEDGGRYCGEWSDNLAHGHGICTGPQNEGLFEGRWEKGNQVSGVYSWPSGQKYYGQWKDGCRQGCGKETMPDGAEYSGDFFNDHREGFGAVKRPNGDAYRGTWKGGLQDGEGVEEYADGGMYRGEFRNGMRHGYGTRCSLAYKNQQSPSSSTAARQDSQSPNHMGAQAYSGQWQDNKRHGYGVLEVPGSFTYYGEWKENARTGYGVLVRKDGTKEEGEWQNGALSVVLKRGKVSLLHLKLDSKVKQAHTMALQAMKTAASRVTVAESRAASAKSRAQAGYHEARVAQKAALAAQGRSQLHANAPVIPEVLKSPVHEVPVDITSKLSTLSITKTDLSSSFENLAQLPSEKKMFMVHSGSDDISLDGEINMEGSIRSSSSCDSELILAEGTLETSSLTVPPDYSTPSILIEEPNSSTAGPTRCTSDPNLLRHRHVEMKRPSLCILPEETSQYTKMASEGLGGQRTELIDHTTGETLPVDERNEVLVKKGDVLVQQKKDEVPSQKEAPSGATGNAHVQHNHGTNPDILMQIAMWNRSMTYVNIVLLIVLLVLIIVTVISLYYIITPSHMQGRQEDYLFQPLAP